VGTVSNGQGHETTFPQVVAARLGVPLESLRFVQGDTATVPEAIGTGASWSLTLMGSSLVLAADEAMRQGREVAAELLEVSAGDVEYADGAFRVVGTDRAAAWRDVFAARPGFTAVGHFEDYDEGFPVACHACEVEIDPDTGTVAVRRYVVAQDAGRIVNPLIAAGQLHGGVAHGLGQALMEEARYDRETAQLLSGSFMDYAMPRAEDLPALECEFVDGPAGDNPLGVKGLGEAGTTGAAPCVVNAVLDALAPLGVRHLDMPLTPLKVWEAIRASGGR
jgi:carbon-monoxide dehydrogenase large subunit